MADVARLGYLDGSVLDVTFGLGTFWSNHRPHFLTACDIDVDKSPLGISVDVEHLDRHFAERSFDVVVFDPPYKLNGTPDPTVDARYGVDVVESPTRRMRRISIGTQQCCAVADKRVLVKVMDQVVSGKKVWQTDAVTEAAAAMGFRKKDRLDLLVNPRPQPPNRRQVHAQQNYSTLLVLERIKR